MWTHILPHGSWEAWKSYPSATEAFHFALKHPFQQLQQRFRYWNASLVFCMKRLHLFQRWMSWGKIKKARLMDNIPATQVWCTHVGILNRVVNLLSFARLLSCNMPMYQASIWAMSLLPVQHPRDMGGLCKKRFGSQFGLFFLKNYWSVVAKHCPCAPENASVKMLDHPALLYVTVADHVTLKSSC